MPSKRVRNQISNSSSRNGRRSFSCMERRRAHEVIRKGPWTAEEDEVLINFVKKNGPRDWSSIRSNGLLPRTGKSCRLRWVNKLRPNLKTGCKFSAEEERVVLDLQGKIGNKWATIASYLPGRTDNDVKNFWSTRQKRLARILRSPPPNSQPSTSRSMTTKSSKGKALAVDSEMPTIQALTPSSGQVQEDSSSQCLSCNGNSSSEMIKMVPLPDFLNPNLINVNPSSLPSLDTLETTSTNEPSTMSRFPDSFSMPCLPQPNVELPLLPESHDYVVGLGEPSFLDVFIDGEASELVNIPQLDSNGSVPLVGLDGANYGNIGGRADNDKLATPDDFFDDFPVDMFDCIEPIPSSSPL